MTRLRAADPTVDLSPWIGEGRVTIIRDYPKPDTHLWDVEVLEAGPGWALLDEPRRGDTRGRGYISTASVTEVRPQ